MELADDDKLTFEREKSERNMGWALFFMMSFVCVCFSLGFAGVQGLSKVVKWASVIFSGTMALAGFYLAAAVSLTLDFKDGSVRYRYGSPLIPHWFTGTFEDVSRITTKEGKRRDGTSYFEVKLRWKRRFLPAMLLGRFDDSKEANRLSQHLSAKLGITTPAVSS